MAIVRAWMHGDAVAAGVDARLGSPNDIRLVAAPGVAQSDFIDVDAEFDHCDSGYYSSIQRHDTIVSNSLVTPKFRHSKSPQTVHKQGEDRVGGCYQRNR